MTLHTFHVGATAISFSIQPFLMNLLYYKKGHLSILQCHAVLREPVVDICGYFENWICIALSPFYADIYIFYLDVLSHLPVQVA